LANIFLFDQTATHENKDELKGMFKFLFKMNSLHHQCVSIILLKRVFILAT